VTGPIAAFPTPIAVPAPAAPEPAALPAKGHFHKKLEELRQQSPVLATLFASAPINRRGLQREEDEAEAAAAKRESRDDAKEISELEAKGAKATAQLRRFEREGLSLQADLFRQANTFELRREAAQLADEHLDLPEPPTAA
jgi:hypothetical protein